MQCLSCLPANFQHRVVRADVNNDGSVAKAVAGAWDIVNTVSPYVAVPLR